MLRLRVHPGRLAQFDLQDVVYKYATPLVVSLIVLVMLMAAVAVHLIIGNRAARKLLKQRDAAQSALRDSIQQLERTNLELENFAYIAAHDLQTPLRNIVSFNQLLAKRYKGRLDSDADDFIEFVVDNAKKMSDLISDLLRYSRVSRKFEPLAQVDATAAAGQALTNLRTDIAEADAEVTVGNLPVVMAEESLLVSLFQNLLGNALKYRSPGIRPRISVTATPDGPGKWRIGVADNGIGIEPQYQDTIFEIFKRINPSTEVGGTGIGLTICRRIVNHFGGRIWVESCRARGQPSSLRSRTLPSNPDPLPAYSRLWRNFRFRLLHPAGRAGRHRHLQDRPAARDHRHPAQGRRWWRLGAQGWWLGPGDRQRAGVAAGEFRPQFGQAEAPVVVGVQRGEQGRIDEIGEVARVTTPGRPTA